MSITEYIIDDLAARLQSGRELPKQLTLDSLAGLYNVSFTPVRNAIAELIEQGLLTKGANGRLKAPAVVSKPETPHAPIPLPEPPRDPFDLISRDLIQLSLKGASIYLREEATAEKYGISRSMIRNILHRLAGEGILDHIPRRGWRLRPFRQADLQSYIEVRESLEMTALELAIPRLDPARLQEIVELNRFPASPDERPQVDESLHDYLIATAKNPYISDFFNRQGRYYRLLFSWEDHDISAAIATVQQHRKILQALLEENWDIARSELSQHILTNHPILNPAPIGSIEGVAK